MEAELRMRTGHALLIRVSQVGERFGAHSVMRGTPNIPYVVCCRRVVCGRRASGGVACPWVMICAASGDGSITRVWHVGVSKFLCSFWFAPLGPIVYVFLVRLTPRRAKPPPALTLPMAGPGLGGATIGEEENVLGEALVGLSFVWYGTVP